MVHGIWSDGGELKVIRSRVTNESGIKRCVIDNLERSIRNKPSYINKFDLVFWICFKNNFICMPRAEGKWQSSMFPNSNCYLFSITRKVAEMKSQLQIDFYKMREGKPPFNNAEENHPRRVAEIFTVRAFMKLNRSRFRSNLAYFSENDCFSHFIQRIVSSKRRINFKNWKIFSS